MSRSPFLRLPFLCYTWGIAALAGCSLTSEPFVLQSSDGTSGGAEAQSGVEVAESELSPSALSSPMDDSSEDAGVGVVAEAPQSARPLVSDTFNEAGQGASVPDAASCVGGSCFDGSCQDGVLSRGEGDVDCGAACPFRCSPGRTCIADQDCAASQCEEQVCVSSSGRPCSVNAECASGRCAFLRCAAPELCRDGLVDGSETDVDCGGADPLCPRCEDGLQCQLAADCANNNCFEGTCISCGSGVVDGSETDVDCGGADPFCRRCNDGQQCQQATDCVNNNCFEGTCISCGSGVIDGDETDVDCGGADPFCRRCEMGLQCLINSDCQTGICVNGIC